MYSIACQYILYAFYPTGQYHDSLYDQIHSGISFQKYPALSLTVNKISGNVDKCQHVNKINILVNDFCNPRIRDGCFYHMTIHHQKNKQQFYITIFCFPFPECNHFFTTFPMLESVGEKKLHYFHRLRSNRRFILSNGQKNNCLITKPDSYQLYNQLFSTNHLNNNSN